MPLLPRVIVGIISVQLVCFWGLLQPRKLDMKFVSQICITIDVIVIVTIAVDGDADHRWTYSASGNSCSHGSSTWNM